LIPLPSAAIFAAAMAFFMEMSSPRSCEGGERRTETTKAQSAAAEVVLGLVGAAGFVGFFGLMIWLLLIGSDLKG
jgi:hypothetical protein